MKLSPNQAQYALGVLMSQGKVREAHVEKALKGRAEEIRSLRERLAALEQLSAPSASRAQRPHRGRSTARKTRRRRAIKMSPRVRALRQLQGKYMGYVRRLKPAEKARVRSVREKQDIQAAIKLAKSLGAKA